MWTSLLYGISATGVNDSVYRLLQSTAATHLRKVMRVHEKGRSNESVLQQADLTLLQHLHQQVSGQGLTLQQDHQRAPQLRMQEDVRHQQIQEQLAQLRHHGATRVLVPQDPTQIAQIPCPVCGIEYANESGLHQHLHRRHPEIEQASKIQFKRSEHSLFGLPFCRFCRSRQGTWSALIKHVTQGMCLRIKLAMCRSQTIDQLMQEIIDEEYMDPPQLPAGAEHQLANNVRKSTLLSHLLNIDPKVFTSTVMLLFFIPSSAAFAANFFARPPGSSPIGNKATLKRGDRRDRKPLIKHAVSVRSSRAHADTAEARPGTARYMLSNAPSCSRYSHTAGS